MAKKIIVLCIISRNKSANRPANNSSKNNQNNNDLFV